MNLLMSRVIYIYYCSPLSKIQVIQRNITNISKYTPVISTNFVDGGDYLNGTDTLLLEFR